MKQEEFFGILDVVDIELFSAVVSNKKDSNNIEEFLEEYEKVELGYNNYINVYCGGDKSKVDINKYVQYFGSALDLEEFDDIGKKSTFKGLNDISDINKEYYDAYGKDMASSDIKTGFFHRLKERVKNTFETTRKSDYNDMIKTIKTIKDKDNTKNMESIEYEGK